MKNLKITALLLAAALSFGLLGGCGSVSASSGSSGSSKQLKVIKGIADSVPHAELIRYVEPQLEKEGYKVELVSTAADETTNEKLANGEIDFNYFQH